MHLDIDSLYTEARADTFSDAKKLFYENKVFNISLNALDKIVLSGKINGDKDYCPHIYFSNDGDLYDYECDCDKDFLLKGPCKHILALALSFEEKNPAAYKNQSVTDATALKAISHYTSLQTRQLPKSEQLHLFPLLIAKEDTSSIKLFIGTKRYKIKNIPLFLSKIEKKEFHRYGTDLAFFHDLQRFDDRSAALISLLKASLDEKNKLLLKEDYKDVFTLLQNDVDLFFEIFSGLTVSIYDGIENSARVNDETDLLKANMTVLKKEDGFSIKLSSAFKNIIYGRKLVYLLSAGGIYKCTYNYLNTVLPLVKLLTSKKEVFVSEKDMPLFYTRVINRMAPYLILDCECDLSVYKIPDLTARLYIFREGSNINAKLECFYGERSVDIFSDYFMDGLSRDFLTESTIKEVLLRFFPLAPSFTLTEEEDIFKLAFTGIYEINRHAEVFLSEDSILKIKKNPKISVGIKLNGGLLDVDISGENLSKNDIKAIMYSLNNDSGFVRVSDGTFINLSDPVFTPLKTIHQLKSQPDTIPAFYAPFLYDEFKDSFVDFEGDKDFNKLLENLKKYNDLQLSLPDNVDSIIRQYQKTGVRWLTALAENSFGGILADDMGLGKSLQLIAFLMNQKTFPCLIVCPSTLILNWAAEISRFAPSMRVLMIFGSAEKRQQDIESIDNYDVIITSYKLLSKDIEYYLNHTFTVMAADEAQFIKNPQTVSAQAVKMVKSKHKFALTGTPIENKLSELWSIFDFIMPGYLSSYADFSYKFELPLLSGDKSAAKELISLTSPFILRRMKSEVLPELPPKIETDMLCPLEDTQKQLYLNTLAAIKQSLNQPLNEYLKDDKIIFNEFVDEKNGKNKKPGNMAVLAGLTKLRQICCDPLLIDKTYTGNSAKTEMCMQLVQNAIMGGHKVLLFSQFTSMLQILRVRLEEMGATYYLLSGDTPKTERVRMANRFNRGDTNVFLISLKAGGTGLNLTGADVVILYDPWWNDPVMNQATDRAYRLGQNKSVQVYKLIVENTIEQKIQNLQKKKSALSGLLIEKPEALNMDKMLELLN